MANLDPIEFSAQSNYNLILENMLDLNFNSISSIDALFYKDLKANFSSAGIVSINFSSGLIADLTVNTNFNMYYAIGSLTINYSTESVFDSPIYYYREVMDSILIEAEATLQTLLKSISLEETILILSPDLELVAFLENYSDFVWNRRWRNVDDFELSISKSKSVSRFLRPNNYIAIKQGDVYHAGRIKKRDLKLDNNGEKLTVTGKGLGEIFENRIAFNDVNTGDGYDTFTGPGENAMKHYVRVNVVTPDDIERAVPNLVVSIDRGKGVEINYKARFQKISKVLYEISKTTGLGWDIILDLNNKEFKFLVKKAKINKAVRLDPNFDSVKMIRFEEDTSESENSILIAGQGQGSDRMIRTVDRNEV